MATTIVTKNGSGAPAASDLVAGELAVDLTNGRLYTEDSGGSVIEIGLNPSGNVDVTGTVTADGANIDGAVTTGDLTIDNDDTPTLNFKKAASADILGTINVTTDAGSGGKMVFQTKRNGNTALDRMTIDDDGSVGIGTDSPATVLSIHDSADNAVLTQTNTANSQKLEIGNAYSLYTGGNGGVSAIASDSVLAFATADTERMRISAAGSVGIGTSSPTGPLHVAGSDSTVPVKIDNTGTGGNTWRIWSTNDAASDGGGKLGFYNEDTATRAMTLDSSGNVGIGTSTVESTLHLQAASAGGRGATLTLDNNGSSTVGNEVQITFLTDAGASVAGTANARIKAINTNAGNGAAAITFTTWNGSFEGERMRIDASGRVGIGTAPSTNWSGNYVLQIGTKASFSSSSGFSGFATNVVATSSGWATKYTSAGAGSAYLQATSDGSHRFYTAPVGTAGATAPLSESMRIDSSGRVGIGTDSPATDLHVKNAADCTLLLQSGDGNVASVLFGDASDTSRGQIKYLSSDEMTFAVNNLSEAMRIDASGNLLVGKTSTSTSVVGSAMYNYGTIAATRDGSHALDLGRNSSDGAIAVFRKDGASVGSIGTTSTFTYLAGQNSGVAVGGSTAAIIPVNGSGAFTDNTYDIGNVSYRFDDIYATNGTIQTSDRNEKQDIEALSDAEQRVAVAAKGLLRKFRWISSVEENGDDARTHFGIMAQDLQAAFTAEGLDAGRYAMFTNTTWTDEETGEERSRMGVRYSELLAFIIAAI